MSAQFSLVLLALFSLTAASDPGCEELLKPLEDPSQSYGTWIFHVGTSDNEDFLKNLKSATSSRIVIEDMSLRWEDKMNGKCYHGIVNYTLSENATTTVIFNFNSSKHEHVGKHLVTCPDCLLWTDTSETENNGVITKGRNIHLFTKSGKLSDSELEVFKKQASCLNFPSEFHFGDTTDLCPDEKEASTEVKEGGQ